MRRINRWAVLPVALLAAVLVVQPGAAADKPVKKPAKKPIQDSKPATVGNPVRAVPAADLPRAIDDAIAAKLKEEKVSASPQAGDAEFLRRVYLDITGVIPTADRAKAFLDSADPNKRAKLIDELLASDGYGKRQADLWQDILLTRTSENRRMQPAPFSKWLTDSFNANKPWNTMVRELVTASGTQDANPAVTYFLANETVDKITDNVARNILGVQLQCAQCHNHPFTGWKQTEYWGMATFFMKVRPDKINKAVKTGESPGVSEAPQIIRNKRTLPESAKTVPAKFLQGEEPKLKDREPYRPVIADWITSEKNLFFAKAMVNRVWAQLFGRGLVNPVDDMHEGNTPSHPELLDQLAAGFAAGGYDVKALVRAVCNSQAYQRTSKPAPGNEEAEAYLYARMNVKVLAPEMLYDSLVQVAGTSPAKGDRGEKGKRAPNTGPRAAFVNFFRADEGADPTEYNAGIPQALRLMNSTQFNRTALLDRAMKNRANSKPEEVLELLYLTILSRRPAADETTRLLAYVKQGEARQGYNDVVWVLLNSSEFALNR